MTSEHRDNSRWWGWGELNETFDLSQRPFFWPYLNRFFHLPEQPVLPPPSLEDFHPPPSRLTEAQYAALQQAAPEVQVRTDTATRVRFAVGKSYRDLIRLRLKQLEHPPDAVLFPASEGDVAAVLQWADEHGIAVVPRGGGTSVVGGVEPFSPEGQPVVVLSMTRLNRVIKIWKDALLADVQAGILGPALEDALQQHGVTLGHFPESFHYSTVGGWVATRSAGQQSTLYGKIEDMVEKVCVITPTGPFCTPAFPAAANGPDTNRLLVGSEGRLGVIVRVRLRVKPLPQRQWYTGIVFPSFEEGARCIRHLIQSGLRPATVRLSDETESDFFFALREHPGGIRGSIQELFLNYAARRGFGEGQRSVMIIGFEGTHALVSAQVRAFRRLVRNYPHFKLGKRVGESWYRHRFRNPYLRDVLLDYGLLVDTLETATNWENWHHLYQQVKQAIAAELNALGVPGVVMAHISHVYPTGTSLYFILLAQPPVEQSLEVWHRLKTAASNAIVENMGTISHHHGVGLDHKPWIRRELDPHLLQALRAAQQTLDPRNILNPGKLFPDG